VIITYGISAEKFQALAAELGVTDTALRSFFTILEQQHVPARTSIARCVTSQRNTKPCLKKNSANSGSGRLLIVIQAASLTGSAGVVMRQP
jgi:hypothetical protein